MAKHEGLQPQRSFGRRSLLGVLAAGGATSLLAPLWTGHARGQSAFPRRLVILYTQERLIPEFMIPSTAPGPLTSFTNALTPLAPHRQKVNILGGLAMLSCINQPWEGKPFVSAHSGTVHLLTGAVCEGPEKHPTLGWDQPSGAGGPSVDQFIASRLGNATAYPSLLFGMARGSQLNGASMRLGFTGKGDPGIEPEEHPSVAFNRLFGTQNGNAAHLALAKRSVLDFSRERINQVHPRLGQDDRDKLDLHLASIRELESRLQHNVQCATPEWDLGDGPLTVPQHASRFIQLTKLALSCDLTRVMSIQLGASPGDAMDMGHVLFNGVPVDHNEHQVSHTGTIEQRPEKQEACTRWKAEVMAELLAALDSVKEGDGTLLDNTLVLWTSQMATPYDHAMAPMTMVTGGSCGGAIKTGQYLRFGEPLRLITRANDSRRVEDTAYAPHNRLLLSICHAMGYADVQTFGEEKYCVDGRLHDLHV